MINDIKKDKRILFILIVLLALTIGFTVAYFQGQIGAGATANVIVNAKTTDVLTFSKGNDISITATQANFGSGAGNRTGSTTTVASLRANNDSNSATQNYNLYLNITGNTFVYTTAPTNTPELLLTITDPSGNPVTSISGLTYTTVNGVSGFDITTKKGLVQLASNYSITSSSSTSATNQTWNITVTFINLNSDQQANTGKLFAAQAIIQKNTMTTTMLDTGTNVNNKLKAIVNYGESNEYPLVAFKRAEALPSGFTATTANTISLSGSNPPVYSWLGDEYYAVDKGDVTGNGNIDSADFGIIDSCVAGRRTCNEAQQIMGDLNGNGELDWDDVSLIIDCSNGYCSGYTYLPTNADGASAFTSTYGSTATMGTVYFYSEADIIYLNADSSNMFWLLSELKNIDDLYNFSTVNVTNMRDMFNGCSNLAIITSLTNWNTSSVTNMAGMFADCNITSLTPLTNWDVSSVEYMGTQYYYDGMFMNIPVTSLLPLSNWDVSSVINMDSLFAGCKKITSLSGLENWDVSSVTDMLSLFEYAHNLANINAISSWDTSSVEIMGSMFKSTNITSLASLANWDVSSVTNMIWMFYACPSLTDASAINDWDVTGVTYTGNTQYDNGFYYMFYSANNVHPTFTKRAGTWDSNGSFIPSA